MILPWRRPWQHVREAVELSFFLGLQNFILESDALDVVNVINQVGPCRGTYGQIINDIKLLLILGGHQKVSHTQRSANGVTHRLAKMGLQLLEAQCWFMDFSPCLEDTVLAEQAI